MAVRGVLFDLDGTLGDTLPVCYAAFRQVFQRRLGLTFTNQEIHSRFGPSEEGVIEALVSDDPEGAIGEYFSAYRAEHRRCRRPFDGIGKILDDYRRDGVRMAVVTGKGPRSAEISLEVFGLDGFFEFVEAGSAEGAVKPEGMRRILAEWGLPAEEVLSVGDSPSDVRSAREVGLIAGAAGWAPGTDVAGLRTQEPDVFFGRVEELASWRDGRG